ncbi:hypothetical protein [Microvirga guangxiensis]|uniref:Uncharacterized protein n=1 Tax=Microvirga guangxiensis TaxID=549386 RepID=A0A1G5KZR8_9HYPH|nr:hypothetical protein [Microvirga guangxiensis]SCZ05661.1 hypothetical protein SAMN02927923_03725 [Microvirga guangxiensis]
MDFSFWALLIVKMWTSAAIVVVASMIVERSGPFLGAMIVTLPISAGPAYAFLAIDNGSAFVSESALVGLTVSAATVLYMMVYAAAAQRFGVLASVVSGLAVWAVAIIAILRWQWSLEAALALNAAVYALALPLARRFSTAAVRSSTKKSVWDVLFRAALVMTVVGVTLIAGRAFGPSIAAVSALAPVVMISVALIMQPRVGGEATAAVVANGVPGMLGFVGALSVLHLCAVRFGAAMALVLALAVSMGWNASLITLRRWRLKKAGA